MNLWIMSKVDREGRCPLRGRQTLLLSPTPTFTSQPQIMGWCMDVSMKSTFPSCPQCMCRWEFALMSTRCELNWHFQPPDHGIREPTMPCLPSPFVGRNMEVRQSPERIKQMAEFGCWGGGSKGDSRPTVFTQTFRKENTLSLYINKSITEGEPSQGSSPRKVTRRGPGSCLLFPLGHRERVKGTKQCCPMALPITHSARFLSPQSGCWHPQ